MGRPLTDKWTGNRNNRDNPVLTPFCNIDGITGGCYILRQTGSNKFLVQNISDPTLVGQIVLTNGDSDDPGQGYLEWETSSENGYVARISDNTIRLFTGGNIQWSIYDSTDTVAYIISNSDD